MKTITGTMKSTIPIAVAGIVLVARAVKIFKSQKWLARSWLQSWHPVSLRSDVALHHYPYSFFLLLIGLLSVITAIAVVATMW